MPSAAILAGGRARRFGGRDKSRLLVHGQTIVERQLRELSAVADDIMIVGGPASESDAGDLDVPAGFGHARVIPDRVAGCGPLGGLDAALAEARSPHVVLLACDMPFVTADFLRHLLSRAEWADAVVPRTERGYHPLCAVYSHRCREAAKRALAAGELRMIEFLKRIRVCDVAESDIERFGPCAELLANVNTPAEFEELAALSGHKL